MLTILESLNDDLFKQNCIYFAGGSLLSLDFGEYRQSKDIDFLCPMYSKGYINIRNLILTRGYKALFKNLENITIERASSDRYGIRMGVNVGEDQIRVEIVTEGNFVLDPPRYTDWCSVPCLTINDSFTAKLLANTDRYMSQRIKSKDLIDLAVLRLRSEIPNDSITKASQIYFNVMDHLKEAIINFQNKPNYREECYSQLEIDPANVAQIIDGIDLLAADLNINKTERTFKEQKDPFLLEPTHFMKLINNKGLSSESSNPNDKIIAPNGESNQINQSNNAPNSDSNEDNSIVKSIIQESIELIEQSRKQYPEAQDKNQNQKIDPNIIEEDRNLPNHKLSDPNKSQDLSSQQTLNSPNLDRIAQHKLAKELLELGCKIFDESAPEKKIEISPSVWEVRGQLFTLRFDRNNRTFRVGHGKRGDLLNGDLRNKDNISLYGAIFPRDIDLFLAKLRLIEEEQRQAQKQIEKQQDWEL